jgi:hypothetical protein
VQEGDRAGLSRRAVFERIWAIAHDACGLAAPALPAAGAHSGPVPAMSEPWYCCAEPSEDQLAKV